MKRGQRDPGEAVKLGEDSGREASEPLFLPVPDGPTQLRALNLTDGSALLHWKPPHKPVDEYNVQVASPGGEHG